MKKTLIVLFGAITWYAVIAQYVLMMGNRTTSVAETVIRFFSFFTILTNIIVAVYFTMLLLAKGKARDSFERPGTLTAVTIYITIVGLVYQVALRHVWSPTGMQLVVNELLHSVIPVLVLVFWFLYENARPIRYVSILTWAIYPLLYLVYILIRGSISDFYPYHFIDVNSLGMTKTLYNSAVILILFIVISGVLLFAGKKVINR